MRSHDIEYSRETSGSWNHRIRSYRAVRASARWMAFYAGWAMKSRRKADWLSEFCQVVEDETRLGRAGAPPRSSLPFRRPAPCETVAELPGLSSPCTMECG